MSAKNAGLRFAVIEVLFFLHCASSSDVSAWYGGTLPAVPDYALTSLCRVNLVGKPIHFTCSAMGDADLSFRWNISADVRVVNSTVSRVLPVDAGPDLSVRDSYLEVLSRVAHRGTVRCSILRREDSSLEAQLSAAYDVKKTVSNDDCDASCTAAHSTRVVHKELGLTCVCKEGYPHRDFFHDVCYPGSPLQSPCIFSHECAARVRGSSCQRGTCKCSYLRVQSKGSCVPVATLNEPCGGEVRCVGRNATCSAGRCSCLPGLRQVDGLCLRQRDDRKPLPRMRAPYEVDNMGTLIGGFVICVTVAFAFYIFLTQRYRKRGHVIKSVGSDQGG